VVFERELHDRRTRRIGIAASLQFALQLVRPALRPQPRDAAGRRGAVQPQRRAPRCVARRTVRLQRSAHVVQARDRDQRLAGVEVGQLPRIAVGASRPRQREIAQRGPVELGEQFAHALADLVEAAHDHRAAASLRRRTLDEVRVRGAADADHEQARGAEAVVDRAIEAVGVVHCTVGREHHLPHVAGGCGTGQRALERRHHFGTALGPQAGDPFAREAHVGRRRVDGGVEQRFDDGVELDHVEAVAGAERVQREVERGTGLFDRAALHRAGRVDGEDQLARQRIRELRRRHQHRQGIGAAVPVLDQHARCRSRAEHGRPFEHEVAIRRHRAVGERHAAPRTGAGNRQGVRGTVDARQRDTGIERDVDAHFRRAGGMDVVAVGVARRAVAGGRAGIEARRVGQRQRQRETVVPVGDRLPPAQVDLDRLARPDVRDRGTEQLRVRGLDQARAPAARRGLDELAARLLLLADLADDRALADVQFEVVHGCPFRQRQHVGRVDPAVAAVDEALADARFRHEAADRVLDVALQRDQLESAPARVARLDRTETARPRDRAGGGERGGEQRRATCPQDTHGVLSRVPCVAVPLQSATKHARRRDAGGALIICGEVVADGPPALRPRERDA